MNSKLIEAFEDLDILKMEEALQNGADSNCIHPDGGTILSRAVDLAIDENIQAGGQPGEENLEFVGLLMSHGADIYKAADNSSSAIECAIAYGHAVNVVKYLERYGS
jgi:hypothetical protein